MLDWLLQDSNARAFLAVVGGVSAAIAALTFLFSVTKSRSDRRQQQSLKAREVWADYMQLAFDHPEYSGGFDFEGSSNLMKKEQYEWFVSRMLYACEEAISYAPHDRWWRDTLLLQLEYHRPYFSAGHFDKAITGYCKPLQDLFLDWRGRDSEAQLQSNATTDCAASKDVVRPVEAAE